MPTKSRPSAVSRVRVQVELFDSRSTSPACSAVKRCWPDSGTYFTFSESPKSAAELPRQMSTFMPVHLPWLSTVMKRAMPPTATPQINWPRALTTSRSLPAEASPACEITARPAVIASISFFFIAISVVSPVKSAGRPDELSGSSSGLFALLEDGHARADRHVVTVDMLNETPPAGRQIEDHLRGMQVQPIEVDDVHIGLQAGLEPAAVVEAEEVRRLAGLPLHHELQRQARPARAVADPVAQHRGVERGIADHAAMRPAVRQAEQGMRVLDHFPDHFEIAMYVVGDRKIDHPPAITTDQVVVAELGRAD